VSTPDCMSISSKTVRTNREQTDTVDHPISRVVHAGFDPIMRMPEIEEVTGLGPSMIYKLMSRGQFPPSTPLTPAGRAKGWRRSQVEAWVNIRSAQADRWRA